MIYYFYLQLLSIFNIFIPIIILKTWAKIVTLYIYKIITYDDGINFTWSSSVILLGFSEQHNANNLSKLPKVEC
jgi:hypothetical protein